MDPKRNKKDKDEIIFEGKKKIWHRPRHFRMSHRVRGQISSSSKQVTPKFEDIYICAYVFVTG